MHSNSPSALHACSLCELAQHNRELAHQLDEVVNRSHAQERALQRQARHAVVGEVAGNIAHQWRQPLNALSILLGTLQIDHRTGQLDDQRLHDHLERASELIQHMSETIDDFRDFFRPGLEQPTPFNLAETVHKTLRLHAAAFRACGIELTSDCQPILVPGSPNAFAQVLLNLLGNARDALIDRDIAPARIHVRTLHRRDWALTTVQDNAGGVSPAAAPHIFKPYFTTRKEGSGIGLHMSRLLVERELGGQLRFHNIREGAEFIIAIPAVSGRARLDHPPTRFEQRRTG